MNGMRCIGMQAIYSTYTAFLDSHMIGDLNLIIFSWAVIHQLRLELFTLLKKHDLQASLRALNQPLPWITLPCADVLF